MEGRSTSAKRVLAARAAVAAEAAEAAGAAEVAEVEVEAAAASSRRH